MKEQLEVALKAFETENATVFYPGLREKFLMELGRTGIDFANGTWRNKNGVRVDINNLIAARLEAGKFVRSKPSAKDYVSPFARRSDAAKANHKRATEAVLKTLFKKLEYHFLPGMEKKALEILSEHFLAFDAHEGITFSKINDSEIGTLAGTRDLHLDDLLNETGIQSWIDQDKTEIARLQHTAALRQTAVGMVKAGSPAKEIEKLTERLAEFEKRSLKAGYTKPKISVSDIKDEFYKKAMLDVGDPAARHIGHRAQDNGLEQLDDLRHIQMSVTQVEVAKPESMKFEGITYHALQ